MKTPGLFARLFSGAPRRNPAAPRVLAYCASNIGAGPLMRLARVIGELKRLRPEVSVLLASDAADTSPAERAGAAIMRLPKFEFRPGHEFKERPARLRLKNRE